MSEQQLRATRVALHAIAELVMAGPQHRASGTIRLQVSPGGFRTRHQPVLAVDGTDLLIGQMRYPISGHTSWELAASAGVEAGAPQGIYHEGSGIDVDDRLLLDPTAASTLANALMLGDAALRALEPGCDPVLWPEHFDVGIRLANVNYGLSPGDGFLAEPYAYIGPDQIPTGVAFWNVPFGAARPITAFADTDALQDFFRTGRELLDRQAGPGRQDRT